MAKLTMTAEEARDVLYGDSTEYTVVEDKFIEATRWSLCSSLVIRRECDGTYWRTKYRTGATEYQDEQPFDYTDPVFVEVRPVKQTITVYEEMEEQ